MFSIGVAALRDCSLLCAAAPTSEVLIAARAVQGVAGALLVPSTLALIMDNFKGRERAEAIGTWTAWTGIATVIGPLGGGVLIRLGVVALGVRDQRRAGTDHALAAAAAAGRHAHAADTSTGSAPCSRRSGSPGRCSR